MDAYDHAELLCDPTLCAAASRALTGPQFAAKLAR
jgi:hypothetical protein